MNLKLYEQLEKDNAGFLKLLSNSPSKHYKVYKIPKRTFGFRTIAQPTPSVKKIQKQIISLIFEKMDVHFCATAYVSGLSIKDNALRHVNSEYLLKVDFENFFNSITPKMLFKTLRKKGIILTDKDLKIIEQFLFWNMSKRKNGKLVLSVGAPSSPLISNLVMFYFDEKMEIICSENNIVYSRYADDMTFSTNSKNTLTGHLIEVRKLILREFGRDLMLNESKTVFSSKAHNRHVTGITLSNNNKLSIGRNKKRYISALIHKFLLEELSEDDSHHLKGLISHALHIDEEFIFRMAKKYGRNTILEIQRYPVGEKYAK